MNQREKLIELLSDFYYSDSPCDSCEHNLETDYECNKCIITHEVDHLLANGVVVLPCRCGECVCWDSNNISCEGFAKCLTGEGGIRYRNQNDFCSRGKRKGGE